MQRHRASTSHQGKQGNQNILGPKFRLTDPGSLATEDSILLSGQITNLGMGVVAASRKMSVAVKSNRKGSTDSSAGAIRSKHLDREQRKRDLRREVIGGNFMHGEYDLISGKKKTSHHIWCPKQWQLLLFVSSTFTDSRCERNILLDRILPNLRQRYYNYDIEVTFVDMRWGIFDDHTLDHKTWEECKREIDRCRDGSCGIFFLSLQNDKYGYRPLPRFIDQRSFDERVDWCAADLKELAREWYQLDTNAEPPQYLLKPLESVNDKRYWEEVLPALRLLFHEIRYEKAACRHIAVGKSMSEWEVKYALRNDEESDRVLWIRREFTDEYSDSNYSDTTEDKTARQMLQELKEWFRRQVTKPHEGGASIISRKVSYTSLVGHDAQYNRYIAQWEADVFQLLSNELNAIVKVKEHWEADGCSLGIPGALAGEFLYHCKCAHDLTGAFHGRHNIMRSALALFYTKNRRFHDPRDAHARVAIATATKGGYTGRLNSICFAFVGESSCGKSALIANLADYLNSIEMKKHLSDITEEELQNNPTNFTPIIVRFCGRTDNSASAAKLALSVRQQLEYLLGMPSQTRPDDIAAFREILKNRPVYLLLDAVDELSEWVDLLQDCDPHASTRIIISTNEDSEVYRVLAREKIPCLFVSALSTSSPTSTDHRIDNVPQNMGSLDPLTLLKDHPQTLATKAPRTTSRQTQIGKNKGKSVEESNGQEGHVLRPLILHKSSSHHADLPSEAQQFLSDLLSTRRRKLTSGQWSYLMAQIESSPTPLYLTLVAEVVVHWRSYTIQPTLETSLRGVFSQIMSRIEKQCGLRLTRIALGLITLSVEGINDCEMEDMLSLDDELLYTIFSYDYPGLFRLPSHVWTRLRVSVANIISEKLLGCLTWSSRELKALAEERYASTPQDRNQLHTMMALYFSDRVHLDQIDRKKITRFPVLLSGSCIWSNTAVPNRRRFEEASFHLIRAGRIAEAVEETCSVDYVCATSRLGMAAKTLKYLTELKRIISEDTSGQYAQAMYERVSDYYHWFSQCMHRIVLSPATAISITVTAEPPSSAARQDYISTILSQNFPVRNEFSPQYYLQGMSLAFQDPQLPSAEIIPVMCARWSPNDSIVASATDDSLVRLWNPLNGEIIRVLKGHERSVTCLAWNSDGTQLASGSRDCNVFLWQVSSGALLRSIQGIHNLEITAIQWSPTDDEIATGSKDSKVAIFSSKSFESIQTLTKYNDYLVTDFAYNSSGTFVAVATFSSCVRIWDLHEKKAKTYSGHSLPVNAICWNFDDSKIATCSDDCTVHIWSPDQPNTVHLIFRDHPQPIKSINWCKLGDRLVSGDSGGTILIWTAIKGEIQRRIFGHMNAIVCVRWCSRGEKVLSASKDGTVILWSSVYLPS